MANNKENKKKNVIDFQDLRKSTQQVRLEAQEQLKKKFYICKNCNGVRFQQIYILKHVTPFDDPELEENAIAPTLMFQCTNCKTLANIFE